MTITRLLVANRGEIARRVLSTCRDLGIGTVAVHSDADAGLPFVREADVAVRLPGSTPGETYLRGDLVVAAALATGADAVHPGYGFLSESAEFARQVAGAGLTWVGPTPESMEQMASKVAAKKLMAAAGVPVLAELSPSEVTADDLPLLVKASAGGGGRGMRVVRAVADVGAAVEAASAEAASAFGDPTVFCEPYVEGGRHVEVQLARRHPRPGRRRRRPGLLGAAPAPEGRRGGTGPRDPRRRPPRPARRGPRRRGGDRLRGRGHGGVPPRRRAVLLPGDEHPAPGRAPGDRAGDRARPGRAAAPGRRGRPRRRRAGDPRARRGGPPLRRGPGRRLAAAERAALAPRGPPRRRLRAAAGARGAAGRRVRVRRRGRHLLRRDARQGGGHGTDPVRGDPPAGRRARERTAARPPHQPRPAGRGAAHRRVPGRRGQHPLPRARCR